MREDAVPQLSLQVHSLMRVPKVLFDIRINPPTVANDYGTMFVSNAKLTIACDRKKDRNNIATGKPTKYAFIGSFNGPFVTNC